MPRQPDVARLDHAGIVAEEAARVGARSPGQPGVVADDRERTSIRIPAYSPPMPTIGDDDRQYWNPMGLFAERLVNFRRRPGRSPLFTAALVALAGVVVLVALVVVIAVVT
jgi:hypothetical protein